MELKLNSQTQKSAIVFVADRVNTAMLPAYGNTTIDTPNLNHLAAQSVLFDFAISDSPDLLRGTRSIWHRSHAANEQAEHSHLATRIGKKGIQSILLTDETELAASPMAAEFDRIVKIESPSPVQLAEEPSESWLASFFAQTLDFVQQLEPGSLLWIHCRTLAGPWDAPYAYRARLADDEDPDPPHDVEPPNGWFDQASDSPDILLGHQQCCAAQLVLFDQFFGVLLDHIATNKSNLFSFLSTRGYPLGEHGQIGDPMNLNCESIHVPYMIRWPDVKYAFRSQSLIQPSSLHDVLCEWFEVELTNTASFCTQVLPDPNAEAVVSILDHAQSIQTQCWKLIRTNGTRERRLSLFKKPDDRWEVNDVRDRCPQVTPGLEALLDDCFKNLKNGEPLEISIEPELAAES